MSVAQGDLHTDVGGSILEYLSRLLTGLMIGAGGVLMLTALMTFVFVPIAYDTIHLQDTLFFAELGWRVLNGAIPTIDFGHFYGGVIAHYVALAFQLFGITVKSIDYAFILMLMTALGLAALVSARRITLFSFIALSMIIVACVLARVPLEELTAIQRPTSAHSFIYNRFAASLAVVLTIFVLVKSGNRSFEFLSALVCGATAYLIVLIKPTFVPFVPAFLLALAVQMRWASLVLAIAGVFAGMLLLDPGAGRVIGAFQYAMTTAGGHTSISDLMLKSVAVFLVQPLSLLFTFLALLVVLHEGGRPSIRLAVSIVVLTVGYAGMTATMGWAGSIGQQTLPFLSVLCLALFEWARQDTGARSDAGDFLKITAVCVIMSFSLPQLSQSTLSGLVGMIRAPLVLITGGPLSTYLAWSDEFVTEDGRKITIPMPLAQQVSAAKSHLLAGKPVNVGVEYVMIADGVALLENIPNLKTRGLAGDRSFSFAMQTKPVNAYPVWVHPTAPEIAEGLELPQDVGLMMIRKLNKSPLSHQLLNKMTDSFRLCTSSIFWELHIRTGSDALFCEPIDG